MLYVSFQGGGKGNGVTHTFFYRRKPCACKETLYTEPRIAKVTGIISEDFLLWLTLVGVSARSGGCN